MKKSEYLKNVDNLKKEGKRNNIVSYIILALFICPFLVGAVYLFLYALTYNTKLSLVASLILSLVIFVIMCHISNKKAEQNVIDIYAKEIPVSCPSCGASFTVIAGNSEPCPYCGANILVNNQGHIIDRNKE